MKKITFAWLLLSVIVTAFSSVVAQTPIAKYFPFAGSRSGSFNSAGQLPGGGYFAVGNADMFDHNEFSIYMLNEKGDSIKMKKYFPKTPYNQNNRWAVRAVVASDGGLFILTGTWDFNGGGQFTYNSVMRTNAQGDSTWCVIISPQDAWASTILNDIVTTPDGGCIVAGMRNYDDYPRLVKISSTGAISWEAVISSSGSFNSVCVTSDGGYIATGRGRSKWSDFENLLVAKFTDAGATVWSKTFYSGLFETGDKRKAEGLSVAATPDGGCMLAGFVTNPGMWASSALLMRMNASGDSLWTKKYYPWSNPNEPAKAYNLVRLPSDQYLMYLHKNTSTSPEATIVKLNSSGDSLWTQIGYNHQMRMMNRTDSEGGILLTGTTMGANYYDNVAVFIRTTSGGVYKSPELSSPDNGATQVDVNPNLIWRETPNPHRVSSYRVQVARDSNFTNIVFDKANVTVGTLQVTQLSPITKYFWRVQSFGKEGSPTKWSSVNSFTTQAGTSVEPIGDGVPVSFFLQQNYPNPFNPSSTIEFSIPKSTHVNVTIFNTLGKEINILLNSYLNAGKHTVVFDGNNLPSGVYFYRLQAGSYSETKKMILLK
ncbi:MAG: T9SS type A sorting domain-containing protein [Bacteroidota bacterium]